MTLSDGQACFFVRDTGNHLLLRYLQFMIINEWNNNESLKIRLNVFLNRFRERSINHINRNDEIKMTSIKVIST